MAFDPVRFRELHAERGLELGEPLVFSAVTGSTNDDALEAARSGAAHGATYVADLQTAGRGRRKSEWLSAPAENLLFSVLLRPKLSAEQLSGLTLAVGLAVRDALTLHIAQPPLIKWPNDVLVEDKKLCGVLVESQIRGTEPNAVVVGIGLNVNAREFPQDLAAKATSLALLDANPKAREPLLCDLLEALAARLRRFEDSGVAGIREDLAAADALLGRQVRVEETVGVARGIDELGRLLVEDASGNVHALLSGSVEIGS
jgi:BirA family transcriptional regulator, biotin operon repressor / biotin---[acetyl-CoA-carboxylase] ligase